MSNKEVFSGFINGKEFTDFEEFKKALKEVDYNGSYSVSSSWKACTGCDCQKKEEKKQVEQPSTHPATGKYNTDKYKLALKIDNINPTTVEEEIGKLRALSRELMNEPGCAEYIDESYFEDSYNRLNSAVQLNDEALDRVNNKIDELETEIESLERKEDVLYAVADYLDAFDKYLELVERVKNVDGDIIQFFKDEF